MNNNTKECTYPESFDMDRYNDNVFKFKGDTFSNKLKSVRGEYLKNQTLESINTINNFLFKIGISEKHTIFSGGKCDGVTFEPRTNRYVSFPNKIIIIPPECKSFFGREIQSGDTAMTKASSNIQAGIDTDNGVVFFNYKSGVEIGLMEKCFSDKATIFSFLNHEIMHQICEPESFYRRKSMVEQNPDMPFEYILYYNETINEGSVELLSVNSAQLIDPGKVITAYPHYTSLMFYLLQKLALRKGTQRDPDYLQAIQIFVDWASKGGRESEFNKSCIALDTKEFPSGVDLYNLPTKQCENLNNFIDKHVGSYPKINDFVNGLRRQILKNYE
jgi:hypothetical protein